MFGRTKEDFSFVMIASLALLGVLRALKIDSSLAVIKNDCFERLAIGQRHSPKDIYKTSHVSTVFECQLLCTEEKDACKSFSFGVGAKGNASCELSTDTIKESADLKPIGTKADTDYDLYIKKLGCTLVIDKNNPAFDHYRPQNNPDEEYHQLSSSSSYETPQSGISSYNPGAGNEKPSSSYNIPSKPPDTGYGSSGALRPIFRPHEEVQQVQTLVSVSSAPQKPILDTYHEPVVGEGGYNYAKPPFRPSTLNYPYDKPDTDRYDSRPPRPIFERPNPDRYDSRPGETNFVSYGHRPIPDKYGSYLPRPDHYSDYFKPNDNYRPGDYYRPRPQRPDDYDRPQRPLDYDRPQRPLDYGRPKPQPSVNGYDRPDQRPHPLDYDRPKGDYGVRPTSDYDRPNPGDYSPQRPEKPLDYDRPKPPRPPSGGYDNDVHRPHRPDRPRPPNGYDRPDRPDRPPGYDRPNSPGEKPSNSGYDRPDRPLDYDRPHRPDRPPDYDRPNSHEGKPPNNGYDRPDRPLDYDRPKPPNGYDRPQRPDRPPDYDRPNQPGSKPPGGGYDRPDRPSDYDRPNPPVGDYGSKPSGYDRPNPSDSNYDRPNPPKGDGYNRPGASESGYKSKPKPPKPANEYLFHDDIDRYDKPQKPSKPTSGYEKPEPNKPNSGYDNAIKGSSRPEDPHSKPIITQSVGPHGESITSIITELEEACFRRVLAGKRVTRALVKRALLCERIEDCQRECADEKRFACEGFNYRLDPTGRDKGECELLEIPLSHLDIGRDLYPDPDYDYYERDRNAVSANCRGNGYNPNYGYDDYNRRQDQRPYDGWNEEDRRHGNRRPRPDYGYDFRPPNGYDSRPPNGLDARPPNGYDLRPPNGYDPRPPNGLDSRPPNGYDPRPPNGLDSRPPNGYDSRPPYDYDDGYRPNGNRREDFAYHESHHSEHAHDYHYEHHNHGRPPYDYQSYEPYLPPIRRPSNEDRYYNKYNTDRERDKSYWGFNKPSWGGYGGSYGTNHNSKDFEKKNYYLPPPPEGNKNWGQYGGSYGNGSPSLHYNGYGHSQSFDFWGLNKYEEKFHNYGELPPKRPPSGGSYLPEPPSGSGSYLPERPYKPPGRLPELLPSRPSGGSYLPDSSIKPPFSNGGEGYPNGPPQNNDFYNNAILPAEPRYPYRYDFLKDECSLRTATGFRLAKGRVKKFRSVPNIYECELLCFKEKDFPCLSYAYRYSSSLNAASENCYLSNLSYKQLDFYTDLEPDRNFDVYTMNNMKKCDQSIIPGKDDSECFWRVRSAQRLDHKVVLDSLSVKSIVECQIECLRSRRFTCRAFSFRYGSPVIGRSVDNCLLTDWPYYELDPRAHFVPEPGFEIYERGSFGHGCEPHHFGIKGKPWKNPGTRIDQLCYIGFGSPARLLPQATRKEIQVATEEECKAECTKLRDNTLFRCMSLSYNTNGPKWEPNCKLSDILQRDLLPNVDCVPDPDAWLFAWDNYNSECRAATSEPEHNHIGPSDNRYDDDIYNNAIGTWRVYSVSGWPCRRGTLCKENRVAGFWYCELEGGDASTWDYCCRPDHQCGFSEGFQYQWCYVGPTRTQWRKCSDRYYPYIQNVIDRFDRPPSGATHWAIGSTNHLPNQRPPPFRPGIHPDRPPAPPTPPPPRPSLDEYEMQFEQQFLDPPKPGGFGQPRHWPLSYLHKEMPPNSTDSEPRLIKPSKKSAINPRFVAIQNLIDVIKTNDLKNVQYQITNDSNKADDVLFVKIPLPTNFTQETKTSEKMVKNETVALDPVDLKGGEAKNTTKRSQKSLPSDGFVPIFRRGFVTRTNATNQNHRVRNSRTL